jgi:hypothetical protein
MAEKVKNCKKWPFFCPTEKNLEKSIFFQFFEENTTKWNMSDPVCAPMACNIVANNILKTA